ncbi:carboxymuconolactone decarboxylase family protein [Noviherbaspirillum saxi]|uniref:Carboxymuconolactone decarboxylase family protein n=1 Tax=Noviherbaspirillum saxi TaxID=2320863 RepID=A0A3A3GAX5_9BURK|nr:carboxymuconolactone decarboxylase family protein [Noviherbaspirillum saxi]RJF99345.1 carboxymuconolactone decarboxylase family protein [Noviherbaspirillum saxi]
MSSIRLPYQTLSPEAYRAFAGVNAALEQSPLGKPLIDLVFLRISQINGCAYCVDMHARDLIRQGEDFQRINSLVTWRETTFYSARERAVLAWTEAVTLIADSHMPDALFEALSSEFSEREIADLGFAIAVMNGWNRMAISFRQPVKKVALHA